MLSLKDFKTEEPGFSDLLPWATVIDDGVILNKDGSFMAGFYYSPNDMASSTDYELESMRTKINAVLSRLDSGWMTHHNAFRVPAKTYIDRRQSHFKDPITYLIDEERRKEFEQEGNYYETIFSVVFTYTPPQVLDTKFISLMTEKKASDNDDLTIKLLTEFKNRIREIEDSLYFLSLEPMIGIKCEDDYGVPHIKDSFLQYLNFCISGDLHPVLLPSSPMYIDSILGSYEFIGGLSPIIGDKHIGVLSISGFPSETLPSMLSVLNYFPEVYRWSTRFIYMDRLESISHIKRYRRYWKQKIRGIRDQIFRSSSGVIDQDALSMVSDTEAAIADVSSGRLNYGYYTSTVILHNTDEKALTESLRKFSSVIMDMGFNCRIETINAVEAYLGSIPGHGHPDIRRPIINTVNLADLLPTSAVWTGLLNNPSPLFKKNSPPLACVASDGFTPFWFNIHVRDIGHLLLFGPTGSGKSTFLSMIIAQFLRYEDATVFAFDKMCSLLPLTLASNGHHYNILGDDAPLTFCPLGQIDSDTEQNWAEDWIITLIELQGVTVTPAHKKAIHTAMTVLRKSDSRMITDFSSLLQDKELRLALEPFTASGRVGNLIDSAVDTLKMGSLQTFEIDNLMKMGESIVLPILLYLFHRIDACLKGQPALLVIDEAWLMLGHPIFREKIREWLKVKRKENCSVILATQSLSDAVKSGIIDVLVESCPTKIYLPNSNAHDEQSRQYYEMFGLNNRQIEIIAQSQPKKHYYYTSPLGSRLIDLALGPITLSFTGVSSKEDLKSIKELHQVYHNDWPFEWLKKRGVSYEKYEIPNHF